MRTVVFSFLFVAATVVPGSAADDGPRLLENNSIPRAGSASRSTASIRVDVNMTLVPVTVMDSMGRNVLGLDRDNFRVIDGLEQRPIVSFGSQDAPVTIGLIFDSSHSMSDKFKTARQAPVELFKRLNPADESFLITLSDRPELRQDLTSDFSQIQNALLFTNPNGTTSLVDAVYMGLQHMKKAHNTRKALIVVSDGGDNNSRYSTRELASLAAEADTQIFSICLYQNPQTPEEINGPALLEQLSRESGGITFLIRDPKDMGNAMAQIGVTMHNQYVIGYYPPQDALSGKYRKIKVQLLLPAGFPKVQIFARSGYYVPER